VAVCPESRAVLSLTNYQGVTAGERDEIMDSILSLLRTLLPVYTFPAAMASKLYRSLASLLTLQTVLGISAASPQYGYGVPPTLARDHLGAVASESEICSRIGTELLKQGGNAADALVGTVACVGVIGMYHSGTSAIAYLYAGLGGGLLCLIAH